MWPCAISTSRERTRKGGAGSRPRMRPTSSRWPRRPRLASGPISKCSAPTIRLRTEPALRDYIHVTDLVRAHLDALRYLRQGGKSEVLNCGYGAGFSVLDVISAVKRVAKTDFPVRIERAPRGRSRASHCRHRAYSRGARLGAQVQRSRHDRGPLAWLGEAPAANTAPPPRLPPFLPLQRLKPPAQSAPWTSNLGPLRVAYAHAKTRVDLACRHPRRARVALGRRAKLPTTRSRPISARWMRASPRGSRRCGPMPKPWA